MDIEKLIREVSEEIGVKSEWRPEEYSSKGTKDSDVISRFEHSMTSPDLLIGTVLDACKQARRFGIGAICIPPYYVTAAKQALRGSGVAVCAAIGIPNAIFSAEARLADAKYSLMSGADELDVAINSMAIKSGNIEDARMDLSAVVRAAKGKADVKAAIELSMFTEEERKLVLCMAKECGAAYVKIQNVLSGKGADVDDIQYVRKILGRNVKIKIDGGVKTLEKAREIVAGGADRIGLSATFAIAEEVWN